MTGDLRKIKKLVFTKFLSPITCLRSLLYIDRVIMRTKTRKFKGDSFTRIRGQSCAPVGQQQEHLNSALRTYATWLVRATRRKMAASGPEKPPQNTPKKEVELA
jgi:hypothetical protein